MKRAFADEVRPRVRGRRGILVGLLLVIPAVGWADVRIEARRHFQNGMSLIARGAYDDGIAELKEAYAIKPHANVLYNIARAYLDAGKVSDALEYYKKYLATDPPDSASVKATVIHLEETLNPPMPPAPLATPTQVQPQTQPSGSGTAVDPESIKKLNALMERLEQAVNKAEALSAPAPEPTTAARGGTPEQQAAEEVSGAEARPYEEQVVSASRRAESTLAAPNATTVITGEEIRLSGATSIVDVLRRVPGADVMVMGVGSANVSLRGFNQRLANKVLVLLDGRTEYQDFLGLTIWSAIPVGIEEIERIEVIRGPGSALYGANAMLGVINIITKAPGSGRPAEVNALAGSGNTAAGSFIASGGDRVFRYRASVGYKQADKWSRDFADDRPDIQANTPDTNLGLRSARANLSTLYTVTPQIQLGLSGGVNRLYTEIYPLALLRNFYFDGVTGYVKGDVSAGPVKIKLFWNSLNAQSGQQYTPIGQPLEPALVSSNVFNGELLYQTEFQLAGEHRLNLGTEFRLKRVNFNYLLGLRSELHAAAFAQDEWKIVEPFRIQASYRVDRHPLLDNGNPGYAQSPRLSAVWIPIEGHALRASFATAFREPTFVESYTDIHFPVPGVNGVTAETFGSQTLKPEQLTALELGYRGDFPTLGLEWDVAAYQNVISNLIDISSLVPPPVGQDYDATTQTYLIGQSHFVNSAAAYTARGLEIGAKFSPIDGLDVRASTAFQSVSSDSQGACVPCTQAPAVKLFGGVSYRSRASFDFSLDAAYVSSTTWIESAPSAATPNGTLSNPLSSYAVINARVGYRMLNDRVVLAIIGTNIGAPHQEHPFGNLITQRFFGTVTVTP